MRRMIGCLFLLVVGACGDDGGSSGGSPKAAASRSADNAATMKEAVAAPESGLAALGQLYADLQVIHQMQQAKQLQAQAGALEVREGALNMACVTTAGNTATYTDCAEGPSTFNGSATVNGDVVTFDVAVDVDPDAYNGPMTAATAQVPGGQGPKIELQEVSVRETGNLTVTATRLDGTVTATIDLAMTITFPGIGEQPTSQSTPITATFALDRDASGCAVGGTMTVTSGDATAVADYGPACGQVTLR